MKSKEGHILIVDDDADFAEAVSSYLEAHGYKTVRAHDGSEGLRLAKMQRPGLIIMDVIMGERTEGFFAVQQIRRTEGLATVPIFVVSSLFSGSTDFKIPPENDWLAQDEFFPKPLDLPELLRKVRARIGRRDQASPVPGGRKAKP